MTLDDSTLTQDDPILTPDDPTLLLELFSVKKKRERGIRVESKPTMLNPSPPYCLFTQKRDFATKAPPTYAVGAIQMKGGHRPSGSAYKR